LNGAARYLRVRSTNPIIRRSYTAFAGALKTISPPEALWFNTCVHIKVDVQLLYWADKLGILLMADFQTSAKATPRWAAAIETMMQKDRARFQSSLDFAWCLFNETGAGGVEFS
jgi:hypothetical protein